MQNSRSKSQATAPSPTRYRAILVGVQAESMEVETVLVQRDGTMSWRGRAYLVPLGRTAVGEAITTLGLTRLRRYLAEDIGDALPYVRRLVAELKDDAPKIL